MRILLIDDHAWSLKILERQLGALGVTDVWAFTRAGDALEHLKADISRVDLIVCDLQMPDMDGIELLRHIAKLQYSGSLVVISGESSRILTTVQSLVKAHALNLLGALQKPVSVNQLRDVLASASRSKRVASKGAPSCCTPHDLRQAFVGGELVNHYQPKVALKTREVMGVESLVRWQHPTHGLVLPDQFVPVAEAHDLIHELTQSVLLMALRDASEWRRAGVYLKVAVNISMHNLVSLELPEMIVDAAERFDIPITSIILEVTESQLMSNPLTSLDILTRLRLKHIALSIDDFGTGYSSLSQLREIPFNELKVDRSFVHGACRDTASRAIVEGSLGMAKALGMTTVAEGVEDQADWDWLVANGGCDMAQGYLIAKPMPANELIDWLTTWHEPQVDRAGGMFAR